jgi:hypothetical protein
VLRTPPGLALKALEEAVTLAPSCRRDELALTGAAAGRGARRDCVGDLRMITSDPARFRRQTRRACDPLWGQLGAQVSFWADDDDGAVWSRRLLLSAVLDVEVDFAAPLRAATDTCD